MNPTVLRRCLFIDSEIRLETAGTTVPPGVGQLAETSAASRAAAARSPLAVVRIGVERIG